MIRSISFHFHNHFLQPHLDRPNGLEVGFATIRTRDFDDLVEQRYIINEAEDNGRKPAGIHLLLEIHISGIYTVKVGDKIIDAT